MTSPNPPSPHDIEVLMDDPNWRPARLLRRGDGEALGWGYCEFDSGLQLWVPPDEWRLIL